MTPGHTITITPASVHVVVVVNGEKVAESDRAMALDETGLPTRYYLPRADVRADVLTPSNSATTCPFKGQASYWSVDVGGASFADLVWSYETPIPEAEGVKGLFCFYNERVDLIIDGENRERPETPFSQ
jgi:uncharacterized protein (DUF427 family)